MAVIVTTAVFYFAKDVLIPMSVASLLAVIFVRLEGRQHVNNGTWVDRYSKSIGSWESF